MSQHPMGPPQPKNRPPVGPQGPPSDQVVIGQTAGPGQAPPAGAMPAGGPNAEPKPGMTYEDAEKRLSYSMLWGALGLVLCCAPVGGIGLLLAMSVFGGFDQFSEAQEDRLRPRGYWALGVCFVSVVLSIVAYTFALATGCD